MENDSKITIIYGEKPVDHQMRNGEIETLGLLDDENFHIICFCDYFKTHFLEEPIFRKISFTTDLNFITFLLSQRGHIVFLNTTSIKDKKRFFKSGMLVMPNSITEQQKSTLRTFIKTIQDYSLQLYYQLSLSKDGILDGKAISTSSECNAETLLENYFMKEEETKKVM